MKKILYLFAILPMLLALVACDSVDEDERFIEMPQVTASRNVLLEEFTGQNCVNCPSAHRVIEALREQYGESMISVSIHAGNFAFDEGVMEPAFQTFKTPEGDTYANMWGIQEYPSGVVDRRSGVLMSDAWSASIYNELQRPTNIDIDLTAVVTEDGISVTTELRPTEDINGHLQLWVVEDSISSYQVDGSARLFDYVHNNVYRASVNGVGGEEVKLQKSVYQKYFDTVPLKERWNIDNLRIVAFVYDNSGVLQVVQTKVESNK